MKKLIFVLCLCILSIGCVSASDTVDFNLTSTDCDENIGFNNSDVIEVQNWDDLRYYSSLSDKNYVVKLKENRNYYPDVENKSSQIIIKNNLTILGSSGAYFGDNSSNASLINYIPIITLENSNIGITLQNVNFKWAHVKTTQGSFIQLSGNSTNIIQNCSFESIVADSSHSSIIYMNLGELLLENSTFKNLSTTHGVITVFYSVNFPSEAKLNVNNCVFMNNFASVSNGCINNGGILTVYNSSFYNNRAVWWAGAIHTSPRGNTTLYNSRFVDNLAGWNGGALYTYSYLQIFDCNFTGNNCTTNNGGGAIGACVFVSEPHIYINNSLFVKNENLCWQLGGDSTEGIGRGGAISLMDEGSLEVYNSTFIENSAAIGSAICAIEQPGWGSPNVTIVGNKFINHTRLGDVLIVETNESCIHDIRDNIYINNTIEYSTFILVSEVNDEIGTFRIISQIKNPTYYDDDILDKDEFDIYVNESYVKTIISKEFTLNMSGLDNVYVISKQSNRLVHVRDDINFTISLNNIHHGETLRICCNILENATGNFTVIINDEEYSDMVVNGLAKINITNLDAGNYTINVIYSGDDNYNPIVNQVNFTVNKAIPFFNVTIEDVTFGENVIIRIFANPTVTGSINYTVDNKSDEINFMSDGQLYGKISNLVAGNKTITIQYSGNCNFENITISKEFQVKKLNYYPFNVHYGNILVGCDEVISVDLPYDATGYYNVSINNKNYTVSVDEKLIIANLTVGDYSFTVTYTGDNNFASSSVSGNLSVLSSFKSNDMIKAYKSGEDFKVLLLNNECNPIVNQTVIFTINNKNYTILTNKEGWAVLNIQLAIGYYTVRVTNTLTGESINNTIKIVSRINENKDIITYFGSRINYKVRIYDDSGNIASGVVVKFIINSKTYYVKTDNNGYAILKINLQAKKYIVTAEYKNISVLNKINVKPILYAKNIFKKKSKKIKFQAKLLTNKGKLAVGKKIIFIIKNKKYAATTNKKGVATIIIKNLKVGKYTITSSHAKSTIKNIIRIRK